MRDWRDGFVQAATVTTISHSSTEEPGGDERSYFTAVEEFIGKTGAHIEARREGPKLLRPLPEPYFAALPGYFDRPLEGERRLPIETGPQGNRMHFAGLGGDELLGGVQNPVPDLAWLLWHLRLPSFFDQLTAWALQRKTTLWSLASRSVVYLLPVGLRAQLDRDKNAKLAGWLRPEFVRLQRTTRRRLQTITSEWSWLRGPPSPDSGYLSLAASISGYLSRFTFAEQSGLPYYDRDLVQFLFAIPCEQVLRARQRRSLMRRALNGIVPDAVLTRNASCPPFYRGRLPRL